MNWQIQTGDCLAIGSTLEPGSANLMICDPPYNQGIDYGSGTSDRLPDRQYLDWCQEWMNLAARVVAENGSVWVLISEKYTDHFGIMLREAGLTRRRLVVWYETFGQNCHKNFNLCTRFWHYCVKNPRDYVWHREAVNRPSDRQARYGDKRASPAGKNWDSVWQIPRLCGTFKERIPEFPTQLPVELLRPIVGCCTNPGDLVVDIFSGSASTGVAALCQGRRYLGVEKNPVFADASRRRLADLDAEAAKLERA